MLYDVYCQYLPLEFTNTETAAAAYRLPVEAATAETVEALHGWLANALGARSEPSLLLRVNGKQAAAEWCRWYAAIYSGGNPGSAPMNPRGVVGIMPYKASSLFGVALPDDDNSSFVVLPPDDRRVAVLVGFRPSRH